MSSPLAPARMHADEVDTDEDLVRRLLRAQFPHWAELPIQRIPPTGTDNAIYRLGGDLAVRLPRIHWAVQQPEREERWLPRLAPHLPLPIPAPVATGEPGEGFPSRWSVVPWLEGENATLERLADPLGAAEELARFIRALQAIDASDGPRPSRVNFFRGVRISARDSYTREALAKLDGVLDVAAATAAWEAILRVPEWHGAPVWLHGDLTDGNLLVARGRISSVIDFGCLGVGDPACDLQAAWSLFTGESRERFRAAMQVDDATWVRGRGWALSTSLVALPYYLDTNPTIVARSRRIVAEVLAEPAA